MLSTKGRGQHSTFGTVYYWCLSAVFASASALAFVRWADDYHLFILGALSFAVASCGLYGFPAALARMDPIARHGNGRIVILLLTAFYVDNGKSLPLWKELPQIAFWLLPSAAGIPLIVYVLLRHPVVQRVTLATRNREGTIPCSN